MLYYGRVRQYLRPVRPSIWFFALLVTTVLPVAVRAGEPDPCPCAHKKHRVTAHAASHATPVAAKDKRPASHPIAGGSAASKAVPIEFERIYKINHLLKKGSKDYFSVPLEPGTELTLAMKSMKKADVALEVFDAEAKNPSVASLALSGEVNEVKRVSWKPFKSGRYAVAIGSAAQDVAANTVIFKASLAPTTIECAASGGGSLGVDMPHEDCFWEENVTDTFHVFGKRKDVYRIEIVSPEASAGLRAVVALEQKKKSTIVLADVSGSGGRVAIGSVVLPKNGNYSVEVSLLQPTTDVLPYTLTVTKVSGD